MCEREERAVLPLSQTHPLHLTHHSLQLPMRKTQATCTIKSSNPSKGTVTLVIPVSVRGVAQPSISSICVLADGESARDTFELTMCADTATTNGNSTLILVGGICDECPTPAFDTTTVVSIGGVEVPTFLVEGSGSGSGSVRTNHHIIFLQTLYTNASHKTVNFCVSSSLFVNQARLAARTPSPLALYGAHGMRWGYYDIRVFTPPSGARLGGSVTVSSCLAGSTIALFIYLRTFSLRTLAPLGRWDPRRLLSRRTHTRSTVQHRSSARCALTHHVRAPASSTPMFASTIPTQLMIRAGMRPPVRIFLRTEYLRTAALAPRGVAVQAAIAAARRRATTSPMKTWATLRSRCRATRTLPLQRGDVLVIQKVQAARCA